MTPADPDLSGAHRRTSAELPFLVNGTLAPDAEARARDHLRECELCRRDFELETALMSCVREQAVLDYAPHAAFAKLAVRIDEHEARRARGAWWRPALRVRLRLREAVILAQAAAIVALAMLVANSGQRAPEAPAAYRTLTQPEARSRSEGARLRVVFDDNVRSIEMRRMLVAVGGTVVDGPSPNGVFTIALGDAASGIAGGPAAAAEWLRTQPGVRFAELVRPTPAGR